jgi:HlyD family secretion protein
MRCRPGLPPALDKAKSDFAVATKELRRAKELNAGGYLSQSSLDTAGNTHANAQAAYAQAQERVRTLGDDQSAELRATEARLQEAQAGLVAAQRHWTTLDQDQAALLAAARLKVSQTRSALESAKANSVQVRVSAADVVNQQAQLTKAQAEASKTKTTLSYTTITAPRDGVIPERDAEEGTIVNSGRSGVAEGTSIVELGDLSTMYVDVSVDETDLADIAAGQQVEIEVDAVGERTLQGKVTRVDPQATTSSSVTTVQVEIEVLDHDKRVMPGLSATCTFLVGEKSSVLTLPTRAIRRRDGKTTVLIPGDLSPRSVLVEVGLEGDETTELLSGLNVGDEVIIPQLGDASSDQGDTPEPPPGMDGGFVKSSHWPHRLARER